MKAGNSNLLPDTFTNDTTTFRMEVHAHAHAHGKKTWRSYFWEFIMLFLAVFSGFLAEYKLEHIIEHDKEKEYLHSLYTDLKENDQVIGEQIKAYETRIVMMDSMITMLNDPEHLKGQEGLLYYFARVSPRSNTLAVNSRTFDQLKNSGNFRLIRNMETSNRIMAYYEQEPQIRMLEGFYQNEFDQYKIYASEIFDPAVFTSMEGAGYDITRTDRNPPLQTYDAAKLKRLNVFAVYMNGSGRGILFKVKAMKKNGEEMITYLEKEYHLK